MVRYYGFIAAGLLLAVPAAARDLTLGEAEALLVKNNRDLQAARRALESADAQITIARPRPHATPPLKSTPIRRDPRAGPTPTLSLNRPAISRDPGVGSGGLGQRRIDNVLRIDQPFERGDKRAL